MMNPTITTFLVLLVVLVLLPSETYAFGAGEIPEFAYLHAKAFRHGDIENILSEVAKTAGSAGGGGSLFGFAQALLSVASGGTTFTQSDVKKVYFGNWLRDYSQAMDIAGLSKLSGDTIVLIVSVLGFVTFGFATEEYQVTKDRLGVYLPVEHIDNPKGYAEKEGDARQFDPRLRPPVNPEELEIDPRTGMKKYMATENRGWDTSTAHIRRVFRACIEHGRRAQGKEGEDLWEAYRLLGTGLHTMEDLLAHSNWCELALRKMGHQQVFCHVGENVIINTPNGPAPPLVTGTFGSADFLHSLMGEATDHLSQASVVDLTANLNNAQQNDADSSLIRTILKKLPIGGGDEDKVSQADDMKEQSKAYEFNPDDIMPPDVQRQMLSLLKWRDDIYRDILKQIQMIPGLESLLNAFSDALNAFVYTILAPYLTPLLQQVSSVLTEGSKSILDSDHTAQYQVFDDPDASDPSHSMLSKDHFALILNEPAGKTALVVVKHSVKLIVDAWFSHEQSPDRVIDQILEAFHHPWYNTGRSRIQQEMFEEFQKWFGSLGPGLEEKVLHALTKESVKAGRNKRQGSDDDMASSGQVYGEVPPHSSKTHTDESYAEAVESGGDQYGSRPSYGQQQQRQGDAYSHRQESGGGYGRSDNSYGSGRQTSSYAAESYTRGDSDPYGSRRQTHGDLQSSYGQRSDDDSVYGRRTHQEERGYGQPQSSYGVREESSYVEEQPQPRRHQQAQYQQSVSSGGGYNPSYVSASEPSYGGGNEYGSRQEGTYGSSEYSGSGGYTGQSEGRRGGYGQEASYGRSEQTSSSEVQGSYAAHGRRNEESSGRAGGYGDSRRGGYEAGRDESESYGSSEYGRSGRYQPEQQQESYGRQEGEDEGQRHHGRRHHQHEQPSHSSGGGYSSYGQQGQQSDGGSETFGAERLNINDEGEERPHHGHHKKHHHHHQQD